MVSMDDLEMGLEFNSSQSFGNDVYIDTETSNIIFTGDFAVEESPADVAENDRYVLMPTKYELDLGKSIALQFACDVMNESMADEVYSIFKNKGAYSKFKDFLENKGLLEQWYRHEEAQKKEALKEWCQDNNIQIAAQG